MAVPVCQGLEAGVGAALFQLVRHLEFPAGGKAVLVVFADGLVSFGRYPEGAGLRDVHDVFVVFPGFLGGVAVQLQGPCLLQRSVREELEGEQVQAAAAGFVVYHGVEGPVEGSDAGILAGRNVQDLLLKYLRTAYLQRAECQNGRYQETAFHPAKILIISCIYLMSFRYLCR